MPELPAVGRNPNPDTLDLDPVVVPVIGYRIETREEVEEKFPFKPIMPSGAMALLERMGGDPKAASYNGLLLILEACVMADAKERWEAFLDADDVAIELDTLGSLLEALVEHYTGRPTRRSSGSSRTAARSGRTSKAARSSTA